MTRLTNDLRGSILTQILKRGFLSRLLAQIEQEKTFAEDVYTHLYTEDLKQVEKVPSRWIAEAAQISLKINGEHICLSWSWGVTTGTFNQIINPYRSHIYRKLPKDAASQNTAHVFDYGDPFSERWERISDARENLETAFKTARAQARAILDGCSSVSRLVTTWPEIEPIVKSALGQAPVALPSLPVKELNKIFDLPPETKAA